MIGKLDPQGHKGDLFSQHFFFADLLFYLGCVGCGEKKKIIKKIHDDFVC
jgi:hypothetical protein